MDQPVTSPQQIRDLNSALLLNLFWGAPTGVGLTASELVSATGLTRATVLAICDDLRDLGWLIEDRAPSLVPGRGRQARRFTFDCDRCYVVASDVGIRSVTSVVADLKGRILGRSHHAFAGREWEVDRTWHVVDTLEESLSSAGLPRDRIAAACIGVAAPVDRRGEPLPGSKYWDLVRLDERLHTYTDGWAMSVENDADLAALAELRAAGSGAPETSVTLLATERLGSGIVVNGEVLRGAHGGAGEMAYLERVQGVRGSLGIAATAGTLLREALDAGRDSVLQRGWPVSVEEMLVAADGGDGLAIEIVGQVEEALALVISTLSSLLDPAVVTIAGGVADVAGPLVPGVQARLASLVPAPPEVRVSRLGRDVVLKGAVWNALDSLRQSAFAV